jgi:hypothetical protein
VPVVRALEKVIIHKGGWLAKEREKEGRKNMYMRVEISD